MHIEASISEPVRPALTTHGLHDGGYTVPSFEAIKLATSGAKRVLLGGNLASLSLLTTPRAMLNYVSECLFLHKIYASHRGIPQRHVYEVFPPADDRSSITLGLNPRRPMTLTTDLVCLCLICRLIQPKVIFEIGTFHGHMAFQFALNTPADCKIYTLDLPKNHTVNPPLGRSFADREIIKANIASTKGNTNYFFENTDVRRKVTLLFSDSARFDYSEFQGKVDFFFIDGAHSYEYVRSDTLNALKCCHPGSVIAWHDFGRVGIGVEGVSRWIVELSKQHAIYCEPRSTVAYMKVP